MTNVALVATLEDSGTQVKSDYAPGGIEYRYTAIIDGQSSNLYLAPEGDIAIRNARIERGETIELLKTVANGRQIYTVHRVTGGSETPAPPSRLLAPQPVYAPRERQPAPPPPTYFQPEAPLPTWDEENEAPRYPKNLDKPAPNANGYQRGAAARQPEQQSFAAPAPTTKAPAAAFTPPIAMEAASPAHLLFISLKDAFDAVVNLEAYAAHRGRPFVLSEESLRACALTLRISASKEGR
jgi:hypothetical protein